MENENSQRNDSVFSRKIRAGRRRTYFFDVRTTKANDYYLTITESKKRFDGNGYERHKLFIYKEDFNKFLEEMTLVVDHIKGLMPDFDFDAFAHKYDEQSGSDMDRENNHMAFSENHSENHRDSSMDNVEENHSMDNHDIINEEDLKLDNEIKNDQHHGHHDNTHIDDDLKL